MLTKTFVTKFANPTPDVPTLLIPDWSSGSCQKVLHELSDLLYLCYTSVQPTKIVSSFCRFARPDDGCDDCRIDE